MDTTRMGFWRSMDYHHDLLFGIYDLFMDQHFQSQYPYCTFYLSVDIECCLEPTIL